MKSETNARPYFEQYMTNLTLNTDRLENGQYTDARVENSWVDYLVGWTHCSLFVDSGQREKLRKKLDEMRNLP